MKPYLLPSACGLLLTSMCAAVICHWWSLQQIAVLDHVPAAQPDSSIPSPAPTKTLASSQPLAFTTERQQPIEKEFYQKLLEEVKTLRHENLNMVDQMAETNRDLMKLEFRVDTHSDSFRPLKVAEENPGATFDEELGDTGLLPPRALPVLPDEE